MRLASRLEILSSFLDVWGTHLVDEESLRIKWSRTSQVDMEVVRWVAVPLRLRRGSARATDVCKQCWDRAKIDHRGEQGMRL
jgi:hypothetical protein